MKVLAYLPPTYLTLWTNNTALALTSIFQHTRGKVLVFGPPPQPGLVLERFEIVAADATGANPYTTVYAWKVP